MQQFNLQKLTFMRLFRGGAEASGNLQNAFKATSPFSVDGFAQLKKKKQDY